MSEQYQRLTAEELREIAERCEKATSGPWKVYEIIHEEDKPYLASRGIETDYYHPQLKGPNPIVTMSFCLYEPHHRTYIEKRDATFIAASRTDIPRLLAHIEAQQMVMHAIQGALLALAQYSKKDAEENKVWVREVALKGLGKFNSFMMNEK